ncbi:MAG TPA: asparagine synthase (glutamine-hydrolyzing) [Thermoanaerobaculia bacterium]|nr:asparagine synthase (glutamine-hydrolyzing) [Thermoanaerobaculia bacterium]
MCGIVGRVGAPSVKSLPLDRLDHRGPDDRGEWTNGRNCTLGNTRLAIIDRDPRSRQPMTDPSGRFTLVLNGEIYNYRELVRERLAGEAFRTKSDTEVLLLLWRKFGSRCLAWLRGMFAFAVWDERDEALWFARDRFGKKPFLYSVRESVFCFASELEPLVILLNGNVAVLDGAVELFLTYGFVPAPLSIYEGVFKLKPGCVGVWRRDNLSIESYWKLRFEPKLALSKQEALIELEAHVREATRLRLRADVPVGVLLSGGIDSSLVTAIAAQENEGRRLKTFSIGFREESFDERKYAEAVASRYGTEHVSIVLDENIADRFEEMVVRYGEPFGDKSALPSLAICEQAAKNVKVILNGDGGDELFAGYSKYHISWFRETLSLDGYWGYQLSDWLDRRSAHLSVDSWLWRFSRVGRFAVYPLFQIVKSDQFVRRIDRRILYQPAFREKVQGFRRRYETNELLAAEDGAKKLLDRMLEIDYRHYLANDLLVKMDIASMSHSLEARSPLLDHVLMEFAAQLDPGLKIRDGRQKYLLRELTSRYVPREAIDRPKQGFSAPVDAWVTTELRERLQDMLARSSHRLWGYCRRDTVRKWVGEHENRDNRRGTGHGQRLWLLLVLGAWLERPVSKVTGRGPAFRFGAGLRS